MNIAIPHKPDCFVYRHAQGLIGSDRRGLCTCGADTTAQFLKTSSPEMVRAIVETLRKELHNIR